MATNRDYCFRHAKMYEGQECPFCAEEEDKKKAGGAPAAAPAGGAGAGGAQPPPGTAGGHRPPSAADSKAKGQQGELLLLAGEAREALDLCDAAVELDPRNLHAHLIGVRACQVLRDTGRERELLEAAVTLLRSDDHAGSSESYHEVLKYARDSTLMGQIARAFVAGRKWPAREYLAMVRALVTRGAAREAAVVLEALQQTERSLTACAFSMQLAGGEFARQDPDLQAYLASRRAEGRADLLAEYCEMAGSEGLSASIVAAVKNAVRGQYEQWIPDVGRLIESEAKALVTQRVEPKLSSAAVSSAIRFFVGAAVVAGVVAAASGGSGIAFGIGGLLALGCAGGGFAYGREAELRRLLPSHLPPVIAELTDLETRQWARVLRDDHEATDGSPGGDATPGPGAACPYCAATVATDATACPQCGKPLLDPARDAPGGAPTDDAGQAPAHGETLPPPPADGA